MNTIYSLSLQQFEMTPWKLNNIQLAQQNKVYVASGFHLVLYSLQ